MAAASGSGEIKEEPSFVVPSADPYLVGVVTQSATAFSAAAPGWRNMVKGSVFAGPTLPTVPGAPEVLVNMSGGWGVALVRSEAC